MIRILRSTLTVPASASSVSVDSDITQADLERAVAVGGSIQPYAFVLDPEDADVTVESLVIGNTKNAEGKYSILPSGTALSLAALNKMLAPAAGGVDAPRLSVAHGARLTAVVSNAVASEKTISVLWKVENAIPGDLRVGPNPFPGFLLGRAPEDRRPLASRSLVPLPRTPPGEIGMGPLA